MREDEVSVTRARLYPTDCGAPLQDLPADVIRVVINQEEVGVVTVVADRSLDDGGGIAGIELDVLPDSAEALGRMVLAAAEEARASLVVAGDRLDDD